MRSRSSGRRFQLLVRLLVDLQELSLLESGTVTIHPRAESMVDLIDRAVTAHQFMASRPKTGRLRQNCPGSRR